MYVISYFGYLFLYLLFSKVTLLASQLARNEWKGQPVTSESLTL